MTYDKFTTAWAELDRKDKINLFNDYAREYNPDDELFVFDNDFFNLFFEGNPSEAVRACYFGNIQHWDDEWLRFNGYGNVVSMNDYDAAEWADDHMQEIYDHPEIWGEYIDDEEEEDQEEDESEE